MAARQSIVRSASPPHKEQDHRFGHWLSGFTDGEGCFTLGLLRNKGRQKNNLCPTPQFAIALRLDDVHVLRKIQAYWNAGAIHNKKCKPPSQPQAKLVVYRIADVAYAVVPHFQKYPLQSKKQRDFQIWREAVNLCCFVSGKPTIHNGNRGIQRKWTDDELDEYIELRRRLSETKNYAEFTCSG